MEQEVLYRYLHGLTTEKENAEVLAWLDADPEKHTAELTDVHYLFTAIDHYSGSEKIAKAKNIKSLRRVWVYAAGVAASIAVIFGTWFLGGQHSLGKISDRLTTLEVPAGQHIRIQLEDGTSVSLNAGSTLEYPVVFAKGMRQVKLSGEALFEVKHDADRPFVVETFASKIEVLGTTFNVLADSQTKRFAAMLVEGSVKVCNLLDPSECIVMKPYDVVNLVGTHLYKRQTDDFSDLCWTEGLISLKNISFMDLMAKFEKAYDVKIVFDCKMMPKLDVMSGEIRISDGIENALHILQQVSDFTYERDEKTNIIVIR